MSTSKVALLSGVLSATTTSAGVLSATTKVRIGDWKQAALATLDDLCKQSNIDPAACHDHWINHCMANDLTIEECFVHAAFEEKQKNPEDTWMDAALETLDELCDAAELSNTKEAETAEKFEQERGKCHTCYFAEGMTVGTPESCNYAKYQISIMLGSAATPYSEAMARNVDYSGWSDQMHTWFLAFVEHQLKVFDGVNAQIAFSQHCPMLREYWGSNTGTDKNNDYANWRGETWDWFAQSWTNDDDFKNSWIEHAKTHCDFNNLVAGLTELAVCHGTVNNLDCSFQINA